MNKTLHVVALCSLTAVVGAQAEEKNIKIGVVDTFKVMQNCESGKKVTEDIRKQQEAYARELQEESQRLAKAANDFQAKGAALKADAREKEEKNLMAQRRKLEARAQELEEELKGSMQKASERIAQEVDEGVIELAKKENFTEIKDKLTGRVIYTKPEFDVTELVTKQVDTKKAVKAPASATKVTQASVPAKAKAS
jgi:outer membrane protein